MPLSPALWAFPILSPPGFFLESMFCGSRRPFAGGGRCFDSVGGHNIPLIPTGKRVHPVVPGAVSRNHHLHVLTCPTIAENRTRKNTKRAPIWDWVDTRTHQLGASSVGRRDEYSTGSSAQFSVLEKCW